MSELITDEEVVSFKKLAAIRDLLLPALWGWRGQAKNPYLDLDIIVDSHTKSLLVKGYNSDTKQALGFAITQQAIADGVYKTSFGPDVCELIKQLQNQVVA